MRSRESLATAGKAGTAFGADDHDQQGMQRRTFLLSSLAVAGAGLLAACSSSRSGGSSQPSGSGKAGSGGTLNGAKAMSHTIINIASLATGVAGFKFAWEALGGQNLVADFGGDPQKALSQSELFGARNIKVDWSNLPADSLLGPYIANLARSHIYYQNVGNPIPYVLPIDKKYQGVYLTQVGASFSDEAYLSAKALFEAAGGEGELIWLTGVKGTAGDTSRATGVNLALKQYPKIKLVATQPANWLQTTAQTLTQQLVPAHPKAKMIMAQNDSIGIGACAALRALNKTDVLVAGVDGDPQFLNLIANKQNAVATSASRVDYQGLIIAVRFYDELMGSGDKWDPLECILRQDDVFIDTPESAQELLDLTTDSSGNLKFPYDPKSPSRHLHPSDWKVQTAFAALDPAFEWKYSIPSSPPADFTWPAAYEQALTPEHAKKVNDEWIQRNSDVFAPVKAKAKFKEQVLGYLEKNGLVPGLQPYTKPS